MARPDGTQELAFFSRVDETRLGEVALHMDLIDEACLRRALLLQGIAQLPIGEVLIEMGAISEEALLLVLECQRMLTLQIASRAG